MNRPVGVTILAILDFILAAFCVLGGIGVMVGGGFMGALMKQGGGDAGASGMAGILAGLGAALGIVILIFGAIYALIGWGMWGLKNWARIITIVFAALGALSNLWSVITHFNVMSLIFLAIDALIIWYLLKPDVAGAFKGTQGAAASV